MTRSERIYRRLLRIYPRSFRAEYEEEMTRLFLDQLDDAGRTGRSIERSSVWLRSLTDIAANAAAEHLRRENSVAKRVDPGSAALAVSPERTGPGVAIALALLVFTVPSIVAIVALPSMILAMLSSNV